MRGLVDFELKPTFGAGTSISSLMLFPPQASDRGTRTSLHRLWRLVEKLDSR